MNASKRRGENYIAIHMSVEALKKGSRNDPLTFSVKILAGCNNYCLSVKDASLLLTINSRFEFFTDFEKR